MRESTKQYSSLYLSVALVTLLAGLVTPERVEASIIVWSLKDVVFADGGKATGSFDWDTTLEDVADYSIAIEGDGVVGNFPAISYEPTNSSATQAPPAEVFFIQFATDDDVPAPAGSDRKRFLRLAVEEKDALNSPVSTLPLFPRPGFVLYGAIECFSCAPVRQLPEQNSAALTAQSESVPLPGTPGLLLLGLLGLVLKTRRRV